MLISQMGTNPLPEHFAFSSSDPHKTALRLVSLTDARTGFTVRTALAQDGLQVPAIMAFAGARFSRSALTAEELFAEINTSAVSAQKKLANIFNNYGHASVGDMAMLFAYIENIPRHLMFKFFYSCALGGGQERSSRFQSFSASQPPRFSLFTHGTPALPAAEKTYQELYRSLLQAYDRLLPIVSEQFTKVYRPDKGDKAQASALQARTFDTVRAFLPAGASTSGAFITSAREWARLIGELKSSPHFDLQALGEQLETLFAPPEEAAKKLNYTPEAPDLIRHTEADHRTDEMLTLLRPFTLDLATLAAGPGKKVGYHPQKLRAISELLDPAATYLYFCLVRLHPMLTVGKFAKWYATLSGYTKRRLSGLLFGSYDHHHHLPLYARTGGYTFEIKAALSEMIDFNRHRSWGRFTPLLETADVLTLIRDGYTLPLYLEHPKLKKLRNEFASILDQHYQDLLKFGESLPPEVSPRLLLGLLPNAHLIRYYLTGGPKEISYLSRLRLRPGGHINYRVLAYELARQASFIDPLLSALRIPLENKPDPFSRTEFFDRS